MSYINEMLGTDHSSTEETAYTLLIGHWVDEKSLWEIDLNTDSSYLVKQTSTNLEYVGTWRAVPIDGKAEFGILELRDERYDKANKVSYKINEHDKLTLYNRTSGASRVFMKK